MAVLLMGCCPDGPAIQLFHDQLLHGRIDIVGHFPLFCHQLVTGAVCKIQGQFRLFIGIYITCIDNKITCEINPTGFP